MSPGSKSFVAVCPAGLITVVRTRPFSTNAHSAAVACQCNSRITPGSSCIETPAIPFEIGNCSTVTSLPKLFPRTLPFDFSSSNLNAGNSFPDNTGSGTLFRKLLSPINPLSLKRFGYDDQANPDFLPTALPIAESIAASAHNSFDEAAVDCAALLPELRSGRGSLRRNAKASVRGDAPLWRRDSQPAERVGSATGRTGPSNPGRFENYYCRQPDTTPTLR